MGNHSVASKKGTRLQLRKPNLRSGFLENGKGQEITYLQVPTEISCAELKSDIESGAVQFRELLTFAEKKPSKFVVIKCSDRESGLMAVSYLASIYNRRDKLDPEEADCDDEMENVFDLDFDDFYVDDPLGLDEEDEDDDSQDWEEDGYWEENPWKIPVISTFDLINANDNFMNPFGHNGFAFGSVASPKNKLPYWYYTRKENICITHYAFGTPFPISGTEIISKLKRYQNNRHVFFLMISDDDAKDIMEEIENNPEETMLCKLILEFSAGTTEVVGKEEEMKSYYETVFSDFVASCGFSLQKNFPIAKTVKNILELDDPNKAELIEKVVRYVVKDLEDETVLCDTHFEILNQFKILGTTAGDKAHKSIKKMEEELVGMEDVKERIRGIVDVMRYNKRRSKMGLSVGNYHNVHMMIGAPGTAKTSIAELLGNIMAEEKLLNGNRFIAVNGAELKGMYVGHSAPKVKALFDKYDIIFIDEAYSIAAGSGGEMDSFGQEAIAQLILELENHGMDRLVMFAGYGGSNVTEKDNKMKWFLEANPGIRSRINSTIFFDSYTPEQMVEIFRCHAKLGDFTVTKKADALVCEYFRTRVDSHDFGNGREARSLLENCMVEAAKRLQDIPEEELTEKMMKELKLEDVKKAISHMQSSILMQGKTGSGRCGFAWG